jgi:hypothetical protein
MPDISSLPIPRYNANDPYYYAYDNKPLDAIEQIVNLINAQVDLNAQAILAAGGSYDLAQRLNVSIYDNGTLKKSSIDNALHNIGYHIDGSYTVSSAELTAYQTEFPSLTNPVAFVRMLQLERDKLGTIADGATDISLSIEDDNTNMPVLFNTGTINLNPSSTIVWKITAGNNVAAEVTTSLTNSHQHYDNIVPTSKNLTPNYINYTVNGLNFMAGSLKVYINGMRIFPNPNQVYVPSSDPSLPWSLNSFVESGTTEFVLTNAITQDDIIMVDFTVSLS